MHTKTGFDQENNAPDNAKDTQSAGVPDHIKSSAFHLNTQNSKWKTILNSVVLCTKNMKIIEISIKLQR